jgi:hypothetical protein
MCDKDIFENVLLPFCAKNFSLHLFITKILEVTMQHFGA